MARSRDPDFLNRLARAAMRVFARKGLVRARMSDIAREMGVSHGSIYNYVESKEALFYLLVDWGMRDEPLHLPEQLPIKAPEPGVIMTRLKEQIGEAFQLGRLDAAIQRAHPEGEAREEVEAILGEFFDRTVETREPANVIERSAMDLPEMFGLFFLDVRRSVFDRFTRYIERRVEGGYFRPVPHPAVAARMWVETITLFARHRQRDPDPLEIPEVVLREDLIALLVRSVLPQE